MFSEGSLARPLAPALVGGDALDTAGDVALQGTVHRAFALQGPPWLVFARAYWRPGARGNSGPVFLLEASVFLSRQRRFDRALRQTLNELELPVPGVGTGCDRGCCVQAVVEVGVMHVGAGWS